MGCLIRRYSQLLGDNKDPNYKINVKNTLNKRQNFRCCISVKFHSLNYILATFPKICAKILRVLVTLITLEWRRNRLLLSRADY
jgi:hypothetical protein